MTIPANSTVGTTLKFTLPVNRWNLDIIPVNRAARKAEKENPLKILKSDLNSVQLYHEEATNSPTEYKVRVIYK